MNPKYITLREQNPPLTAARLPPKLHRERFLKNGWSPESHVAEHQIGTKAPGKRGFWTRSGEGGLLQRLSGLWNGSTWALVLLLGSLPHPLHLFERLWSRPRCQDGEHCWSVLERLVVHRAPGVSLERHANQQSRCLRSFGPPQRSACTDPGWVGKGSTSRGLSWLVVCPRAGADEVRATPRPKHYFFLVELTETKKCLQLRGTCISLHEGTELPSHMRGLRPRGTPSFWRFGTRTPDCKQSKIGQCPRGEVH